MLYNFYTAMGQLLVKSDRETVKAAVKGIREVCRDAVEQRLNS